MLACLTPTQRGGLRERFTDCNFLNSLKEAANTKYSLHCICAKRRQSDGSEIYVAALRDENSLKYKSATSNSWR